MTKYLPILSAIWLVLSALILITDVLRRGSTIEVIDHHIYQYEAYDVEGNPYCFFLNSSNELQKVKIPCNL